MKKRTISFILIAAGLAGFLIFNSLSAPDSALVEACKMAVTQDDPTATLPDSLIAQCEKDQAYALMMTSGSIDPQAIASSNRSEVLFSSLRWFFLGLGIVGALSLLQRKK